MKELLFPRKALPGRAACRTGLIGTSLLLASLPSFGMAQLASSLADLSFEELANIQVTSVSKKAERLADAAASVFVITAGDIHRSGATSLPEALRLAPNLQVAQVNNGRYAISARGLNGSNSSAPNKLLVMIDGRSVYTPLFSGVFWDMQDVMLEDVERIEVISGPSGTLWGINAVNGVINIITRSAKDTQGKLLVAGGGNHGSDTAFRYGGTMGADGNYRVYGKYTDRNHTSTESGSAVDDAGYKSQAGFRADWDRSGNQFMVQGNIYDGAEGQPAPGEALVGAPVPLGTVSVSGVNLTTHWAHLLDDGSSLSLQAYYDRTRRDVRPTYNETLDIVDVQLQHSLRPIGMHAIVWGTSYRYSMDRVTNSPYLAFLPANVDQRWASLFAQDELTLRDGLRLTLGARMERNDYTGNEFLPSARLAWKPASEHLLWAAASRTVRAPSRLDVDAYIPRSVVYQGPPAPGAVPFLLNGGAEVGSEVAKVYEIGYRGQPTPKFSYSVTAFHADYDDLRTQEANLGGVPSLDYAHVFAIYANGMTGEANGVETWGTYQATPFWRLSAGFTALHERFWLKPGSNDTLGPNAAGKDPAHTWQLRSSLNIDPERDLDITVRHVAALWSPTVPAYTTVDARFGWRLQPDLELSITGQNLFGHHAEYHQIETRSEFSPGIFVQLAWRG